MLAVALVPGIVLGLLVAIWTFVIGFAGWYKDPAMLAAFFLVIPIQIAVVLWGLRRGADAGFRYGRQIGVGLLLSLVGGVIIIGSSLLFTTVAFPDYFDELKAAHAGVLRQQGRTDEAGIAAEVEAAAAGQTPLSQAFQGFVGTMGTGLVVSLLTAIFLRAR